MLTSDVLFALLCLIVGAAIPVVPVVLISRRARRQIGTAASYREVARALDLDVDTRGLSLHGVRDDRPLWIGEVLVGEGPERRREVHGVIGFRHPLGLGVEVRTRRSRRDEGERLDHPVLDKRLRVTAASAEALDAIRGEHVLRHFVALVDQARDLHLSDERLRVRLSRSPDTTTQLGALVERLEDAAIALETAARQAPRAEQVLGWTDALRTLARAEGLRLDEARVRLHGGLAGWPVEIVPHYVHDRWTTWLAVRFAPEVDTGLRVHPQRSPDPDGQDIRTGEGPFDAAFVVKGYDPEAVRTRLTPGTRSALLGLHRLGAVSLDDHALVVRELPPGCLEQALPHARAIAAEWSAGSAEVRVIDVG